MQFLPREILKQQFEDKNITQTGQSLLTMSFKSVDRNSDTN